MRPPVRPPKVVNLSLRSIPISPFPIRQVHARVNPAVPKSVRHALQDSSLPTLGANAQKFVEAVKLKDILRIRNTYPFLAQAALVASPDNPDWSLCEGWALLEAVDILSTSPNAEDRGARLETLSSHLLTIWKDVVRADTIDRSLFLQMLQGLLSRGNLDTVRLFLSSSASSAFDPGTQLEMWDATVRACVSRREKDLLDILWKKMGEKTITPSTAMCNCVLGFLCGIEGLPPEEVGRYLEEMKSRGVSCNAETYSLILRYHSSRGDTTEVERLTAEYHASGLPRTGRILNALSQCHARKEEPRAAWVYIRILHDSGEKVERETLMTITECAPWRKRQNALSAGETVVLSVAEKKGGDGVQAAALLEWKLGGAGENALNMLQQLHKSDATHLGDRILELVPENPGSDANLTEALSVYRDLRLWNLAASTSALPFRHSRRVLHSVFGRLGPGLLRQKHFSEFKSLCADMGLFAVRGISVWRCARLALKTASTHEEAFDCFLHCMAVRYVGAAEQLKYILYLRRFILKTTMESLAAPAPLVLQLISDIQRMDTSKWNEPESILFKKSLRSLLITYNTRLYFWKRRRVQRQRHPTLLNDIREYVRQVNEFMRYELRSPPNPGTWNALMNAYNHGGSFDECMELFEELRQNRMIDDVTVSIILDACSSTGAVLRAEYVWQELIRTKYPLSKRHWDTLVECWAHMGKQYLDRALDVAIFQMGPDGNSGWNIPPADLNTMDILIVYGKKEHMLWRVMKLIKQYLPKLHAQILERQQSDRDAGRVRNSGLRQGDEQDPESEALLEQELRAGPV